MLLREMFSPMGGPKENDQDINWGNDLKFYIDNNDRLLEKYFFPAIRKHEKHAGNPNVYKLYLQALMPCLKEYCSKFEIKDSEEKFSKDVLEELAKSMAKEQEAFIKKGDYRSHR
jgi:hypothetical protein